MLSTRSTQKWQTFLRGFLRMGLSVFSIRKTSLNIVKSKILNKEITSNIEGLKFVLSLGCEPKLFVDIVKELIAQNIVKIDGVFNRTSSNIHRASEYHIVLK